MRNKIRRLEQIDRVDRDKPIKFYFNNRAYSAFEGDTLASALLANGVKLVSRSFKFHRPRGIFGSWYEEPNALVQTGLRSDSTPNQRATTVELFDGLRAKSVNVWPNLHFDILSINDKISSIFPAGFYYKTFMWPHFLWPIYEYLIRHSAGLGRVPEAPDQSSYEKQNIHCDILVIGGGVSGLAAALSAAKSGARTIIVDDRAELGGPKFDNKAHISGQSIKSFTSHVEHILNKNPDCEIFTRTSAFMHGDHNFIVLNQKVSDHIHPELRGNLPRERLLKVRAGQVIYATGALERSLVFENNDRPGTMLCSAVSEYINNFGICPGKRVVISGNNDTIYILARDLLNAGAEIVAISDARKRELAVTASEFNKDLPVYFEQAPIKTHGRQCVRAVTFGRVSSDGFISALDKNKKFECDLLCLSGGFDPNLSLFCQSGGDAVFNNESSLIYPNNSPKNVHLVGSSSGIFCLRDAYNNGLKVGIRASELEGFSCSLKVELEECSDNNLGYFQPVWGLSSVHKRPKDFVDLHNDVIGDDIRLAVQEGYQSIEHFKRYTTTGMGPDQGKTGNINAMVLLAKHLGKKVSEIGLTRYRAPWVPVTFGAFAGRDLGILSEPIRKTSLHYWHEDNGAIFEDVGQWKRPRYYPQAGESIDDAVVRECHGVRNELGIFDASTLGKIEISGPDSGKFLNRIYTNKFDNLSIGSCRYGLMLKEDGMIMDDGVTSRLDEHNWFMTTTTSNSSLVFNWLDEWLQCEWPSLKVFITSVTGQWSNITIAGPNSRKLLAEVSDINTENSHFPHLTWQAVNLFNIECRVFRISFTGELSYEINVPSQYAQFIWNRLIDIGKKFSITPFGTETLHVLRAEKGYIAVGHDTDGTVTPNDLGLVKMLKSDGDYIGRRSLYRSDTSREGRLQFIGLLLDERVPEGAPIVEIKGDYSSRIKTGYVSSSYYSPTLDSPLALGFLQDGLSRLGDSVQVAIPVQGRNVDAKIVSPVFYDPSGERLNG